MKSNSSTQPSASKAKFIGLFVVSLVLCVAVAAAFWGPFPGSSTPQAGYSAGRSARETYPAGDSTIYLGGQTNASSVSDAEDSLRASLDSLHGGSGADSSQQISTTLNLFREAIKNPRSVSLISDALNNGNKPAAGNSEELGKLKDELLVKEGQVVSLQNQLKAAQSTSSSPDVTRLKQDLQTRETQITALQNQLKATPKETGSNPQALIKMKEDLQAKDAQITKLANQLKTRPAAVASGNTGSSTGGQAEQNKKLLDENNFLKWAVRSEVSSNHNLTNLNSSLKQANASLQNQVNELKKSRQ